MTVSESSGGGPTTVTSTPTTTGPSGHGASPLPSTTSAPLPRIPSPAEYARQALAALAPADGGDLWAWCSRHLRLAHDVRWDPRRAQWSRRAFRIVQARLSRRPDPQAPHAEQCEQLWICGPAQIAKSTLLMAVAAGVLRSHPRRAAYYSARKADLDDVRRFRLQRLVEATAPLERLLPRGDEARAQALGPRTWALGTGLLWWLCGSIAADCRANALSLPLCDEIDTWPSDVDGYGDPLSLILDRQRTFPQSRLILGTSSPGAVNGHMWRRLCSGTHERLLVSCSACEAHDWLDPRRIVLADDRPAHEVAASEIITHRLARWVCTSCGTRHDSEAVTRMAREAEQAERWCPGVWTVDADHPAGWWRPNAERDGNGRLTGAIEYPQATIISQHINALHAVDVTLDRFAASWAIADAGTAGTRVACINSDWAEPNLTTITTETTEDLTRQAQTPQGYRLGTCPAPVAGLLLMFDQQGNRRDEYWWPWTLRAVALGGESWLVSAGAARSEAERDAVEAAVWTVNGQNRRADLVIMDSANGNARFDIYLWAAANPVRRLLVRGDARLAPGIPWQEVVDDPRTRRRTPKPPGVREYRISAHHWRTILWDRITRKRAPAWWLPNDVPEFYLRSLTSEEQIVERRRITGHGWVDVVVWRPRLVPGTSDRQSERTDNHWWDCEANLCALTSILRLDVLPTAAPTVRPPQNQHHAPALADRRRSTILGRR
jgi:hypothetical protein